MVLFALIIVATVGYRLADGKYGWLDCLYLAVVTISTLGMAEAQEMSSAARTWTIFVVCGGVLIGGVVLSLIVAMVVQGQLRGILGRRQLQHKIESLTGHVIICGFGRMGRLVATRLVEAGRQVVVIDNDSERTAAAGDAGLLYVHGDAQEEATLEAAGVTRAQMLIATLADDPQNVFVTLTARQANPQLRIVARAQEQSAQEKLMIAGATRVVSPQVLGASRMVDIVLRPAVVDFVEIASRGVDLELDQLQVGEGSRLVGKTLEQLELPRRTGAHVVAVRRAGGEAVYHLTPQLELQAGDTIILVGRRGAAAAVQKLQAQSA